MEKFYFTYGADSRQPFRGGWTEIIAPDFDTAVNTFMTLHPCQDEGILNCCTVYPEAQFKRTEMAQCGNYGKWCHERIRVEIETCDPEARPEDLKN